jgi:hypothetical protein
MVGGAAFRGGMVSGGFRSGFRGIGVGGIRPGWGVGRPGWGYAGWRRGWGWPIAAGIAAAGYYGGYYGGYDDCFAWNGYRWVNVCYSGYYPYSYW